MLVEEFKDYVLILSGQVAGEPTANPILDAEMAVLVLLPAVLREAIRRSVKNHGQIKNLIKEHSNIAVSSGVAELPDGVREEFADLMMVGTSNSDLGLFSYVPHYFDFIREASYILPRFTLKDGKIYVSKTGAAITSIVIHALTEPDALGLSDEIEVDEAIMNDCLMITASILRGELPLLSVGITAEMMQRKGK